jgi:hypothetical protein
MSGGGAIVVLSSTKSRAYLIIYVMEPVRSGGFSARASSPKGFDDSVTR